MLVSKLRVVFENAAGELELWNKTRLGADRLAAARAPARLQAPPRGARAHPGRGRRARAPHRRARGAGRAAQLQQLRVGASSRQVRGNARRGPRRAERAAAGTDAGEPTTAARRASRRCALRAQAVRRPAVPDRAFEPRSSPGSAARRAMTCPGSTRATRTACGCPRSCCSRPRWRRCSAYYARFLERFPDVAALAAAPLDDVLAAVERTRLLQPRAQPASLRPGRGGRRTAALSRARSAALATLPGIGRSTAAAIAAFCFGERAAILDGNVKRVLTRALGFDDDLAQRGQRARAVGTSAGAAARSPPASSPTRRADGPRRHRLHWRAEPSARLPAGRPLRGAAAGPTRSAIRSRPASSSAGARERAAVAAPWRCAVARRSGRSRRLGRAVELPGVRSAAESLHGAAWPGRADARHRSSMR